MLLDQILVERLRTVVRLFRVSRPTHISTCVISYVVQGPIDYKLYEAYGGGVGKAVTAVLNNVGATRAAIGVLAGIAVR